MSSTAALAHPSSPSRPASSVKWYESAFPHSLLVVRSPFFFFAGNELFRFLEWNFLTFRNVLYAYRQWSMYKKASHIWVVPQYIICTTANEKAGLLIGQFADDFRLYVKYPVSGKGGVHGVEKR